MPRSGRLILLAVLFAIVAALELRLAWVTFAFATHPETIHYRLPTTDKLIVNVDQFGGLRRGDRVVEVDGQPATSRAQAYRAMIGRPVGVPVPLIIERAGQRLSVEAPTRPFPARFRPIDSFYLVMQNVVTPWFCILLGFFVVYRRPGDNMAWFVLLILLGQAQFNSFLFQVDGWSRPWSVAMRFFGAALGLLGAIAWLWFGLDFLAGAQRRFAGWLRWPLTAAVGFVTIYNALQSVAGAEFPGLQTAFGAAFAVPFWLQATLAWVALMVGYANLVYRLRFESSPDTRRRLRLLVWGLLLGRGPSLALQMADLAGRGFNTWPEVVRALAFLLSFVVPLTFAYVLIVERAMDVGVVVRQGLQYAFARRSVDGIRVALAILPLALIDNRWQAIGWSLLAFVLVGPAAERLRRWIDKRFFREAVQAEVVLAGLAGQLRDMTDSREVLAAVSKRVSETLHVAEVETRPSWAGSAEPVLDHDGLILPLTGRNGLLGALRLGPKRSQEPYSPAEIRLLTSVAHQAGLALENARLTATVAEEAVQRERIQRELEIAKSVQARLLPKRDPEIPGLDIAGICRPAQSIGGDSYDYVPAGDGRFLFTIADVSGKGVPAALLMSNLQAGLRGLMLAGGYTSLSDVLARLNELVYDSTPANRFITFFAVSYDPGSRLATYSSAGHNPAALIGAAGQVEWIRTQGIALGLKRRSAFTQTERALVPGDCLVLYTDGVTEAVNPTGDEFGEARLEQALLSARDLPATGVRDALIAAVDAFAAGAPQHDDITLVVLRAKPALA